MKISIDVTCLSPEAYRFLQQTENCEALIVEAIETHIARMPANRQQDEDIRDMLLRLEQKIDGLYRPTDMAQPSRSNSKRVLPQQHIPSEKPMVLSKEEAFDPQQAVDDLAKALEFFS